MVSHPANPASEQEDNFLLLSHDQFQQLSQFQNEITDCTTDKDKRRLLSRTIDKLLDASTHLGLVCDAFKRVMSRDLPKHIIDSVIDNRRLFDNYVDKGSRSRERFISALKRVSEGWGRDVVQHYELASKGLFYCEKFRAATRQVSDLSDGITKLNRIMLLRTTMSRRIMGHSPNPIESGDLETLRCWPDKEDFCTKSGHLLRFSLLTDNELPSGFGLDRFGLLVRERYADPEQMTLLRSTSTARGVYADGPNAENPLPTVAEQANSEAEGYTAPAEEGQAGSEAGNSSPITEASSSEEEDRSSPATDTHDLPDGAIDQKSADAEYQSFVADDGIADGTDAEDYSTAVADTRDLIGGAGANQANSVAGTDAEDLANLEAPGHSPAEDGQVSSAVAAAGVDADHPPSVEDKQPNPLTDPVATDNAGRVLRARAGKPIGAQGGGTPLKRPRLCCNDVPASLVKALDDSESLSAEQYGPYGAKLCHRHTRKLLKLFLTRPILDPPPPVSEHIPPPPVKTTSRRRRCSMSDLDGIADPRGPALKRRRLPSMLTTRDDTDSSTHQDRSPEWKGAASEYIERTKKAIKDMRELMCTANKPNKPEAKTRFQVQVGKYEEILRRCTPGKPITADEYLAGKWNGPTDRFVLCSSEEAKSILTKAPLRLPIFVPAAFNPGVELLSLDQYLTVLETRRTLDVHDFDAKGDTQVPVKMESRQAIALFREDGKTINMVSLPGYKQNSTPACIAGIQALTILEAIEEETENGNVLLPADLSPRFQLCSNKGSFSFEHMDSASTITSIQCDHGEKLWPLWPGHGLEDISEWAESDDLPDGPCVGMHLWPGCLLIQPPACIHAPSSVTDVLMTGTRHWDSRAMLQVMESVKIELKNPYVTNEPLAREFLGKMKRIRELWDVKHKAWPWGSRAEFGQFTKLVEVRNPSPVQVLY